MSDDQNKKTILLSAGGTGGHMFPAVALAHDLKARGFDIVVATDKRGFGYKDQFTDMPVHLVNASSFGRGIFGKIKGVVSLGFGSLQAMKLILKVKPSAVVGFGGYPSAPAVYAAQKLNIPTVLHEQNAVLGRANLFLAPKADRIALSLSSSKGLHEADLVRTVVTGNPVREDIATLYTKPYPNFDPKGSFRIFVMGGSLGAQILSDIVPSALSNLPDERKALLEIVQQCREEDIEATRKIYDDAGIKAQLGSFFDDVPALLESSHLIIGRAGASTVAEVTAAGRPAIFVPYPHHRDQQQYHNAKPIEDLGGAWILKEKEFTQDALLNVINGFYEEPETLFRAAEASRNCGKPDATRRLGNLVTALASGWDKKSKKSYDLTRGLKD